MAVGVAAHAQRAAGGVVGGDDEQAAVGADELAAAAGSPALRERLGSTGAGVGERRPRPREHGRADRRPVVMTPPRRGSA